MSEEVRFEIGNKAEQLYFSVFDITTIRQHYPVRYRRIADKLQEISLNIYGYLLDANSYVPDSEGHRAKRIEKQTLAITECNKFLSLVRYSLHAKLISAAMSEQWTGLAYDIKHMTLAWRKKT
ncbi:MAG: hypothetical protein IJ421_11075 [Prevotella sp.]|nr:hypothetical protein [Prevotella sp.]